MLSFEHITSNLVRSYDICKNNEEAQARTRRIFEHYRANGVILADAFDEEEWKIWNELQSKSVCFSISEDEWQNTGSQWLGCTREEYISTLKLVAALSLGLVGGGCIQRQILQLRRLATTPNDRIQLDKLPGAMLFSFLELLPGESLERDALFDSADSVIQFGSNGGQRKLAPFSTYVSFHERISGMYKSLDDSERIHWFPIWFWWNYSMILPTRTTELLLTPRNCLSAEDTDHPLLQVRKTLLKQGRKQLTYTIGGDYECTSFPIPKAMADEIRWYIHATAGCRQSAVDALFVPEGRARYFTYAQMRALLSDALEKFGLDNIRLGDTRHLAMISLVLAGNSPEICKELARHANITDSAHYFTNMRTFLDSAVMYFVRQSNTQPVFFGLNTVPVMGEAEKRSRVSGGYCDVEDIASKTEAYCLRHYSPGMGIGNCSDCPHYIPDDPGVRYTAKEQAHNGMHEHFKLLIDQIDLFARLNTDSAGVMSALNRFRASAHRYAVFI